MTDSHAARLKALRAELDRIGLDGFVVPLTDEHMSEYVADYAQRLAWLTGFTGSAGSAIVLADKAAVFVDGRYTLQAEEQVDAALFERVATAETEPLDWLEEAAQEGMTIGYDPTLHTVSWIEKADRRLRPSGMSLQAVEANPIDAVWRGQPPRPGQPVRRHPLEFAGLSAAEKRREIAAAMAKSGAKAAVLTQLDSIAWLFNIRGGDVAHTPVSLAYATVRDDGTARLFIDAAKLGRDMQAHLGEEISVEPYEAFYPALEALAKEAGTVLADPDTANAAVFARLEAGGAAIVKQADPCALLKARKNAVEISGTKNAHVRDGAALVSFLHWLDGQAPKGGLDELAAADKLETFRRDQDWFTDLSFDTISGAGPNGAIVHYRVTEDSARPIKPGELYLVDSGGQYLDGTTDVTRTVAIGEVGDEEKDRFTRVLKGHIAIATLRFPKGTTGTQIDVLARYPLWQAGLDYDHGTGHGVGAYLAVHEGPQRIAKAPNTTALEPGMILSNEPGYYKTGGYGIRIENLVLVVADEATETERPFLRFETLTLAPIDRRLVKTGMLDADERRWLDDYHARVREELTPRLAEAAREWLYDMTEPLEA